MVGMKEIVDWAREHTEINYDDYDLVIGRYGINRFRIFIEEGYAGVIGPKGTWRKAKACYTLREFQKAIDF